MMWEDRRKEERVVTGRGTRVAGAGCIRCVKWEGEGEGEPC
jgi:hypothetical protein